MTEVRFNVANMKDFTITDASVKQVTNNPCANDSQPPMLSCQNMTVSSTSLAGVSVDFDQSASDNCSTPVLEYLPASGSLLPCGISQVTALATDDAGNQSQCTFEVEVQCSGFNFDGLINYSAGGFHPTFDETNHLLVLPPADDSGNQGLRIELGDVKGAGLTMSMPVPDQQTVTLRAGGTLGGQDDRDIYSCTLRPLDMGGEKYMSVSFSGTGGGGPGGLNMHWRTVIQNGEEVESSHTSGISNVDVFQYQTLSAATDWTVNVDQAGWTFINRGDINVIGPDDEKILLPAGSQIMIMPLLTADPPDKLDELFLSLTNTSEPIYIKKEELILFDDKLVNHSINDTRLKGDFGDFLRVCDDVVPVNGVTVSWEDKLLPQEKVNACKIHWTNLQPDGDRYGLKFRPYGENTDRDLESLGELSMEYEDVWYLSPSFTGSPPDDSIYIEIRLFDTIPYKEKISNTRIKVQYPPVGVGYYDENANESGHEGFMVYLDKDGEIEINGNTYIGNELKIFINQSEPKELKKLEFENASVSIDITNEEISTQYQNDFYHYGLLHQTTGIFLPKNDKEEENIIISNSPDQNAEAIIPLGEVLGHSLNLILPHPGDLQNDESLSIAYTGEVDGEPNRQISTLQYNVEEVNGEKYYKAAYTHVPAGTLYTVTVEDADGNQLYSAETGSNELYWLTASGGGDLDFDLSTNLHEYECKGNKDDIIFLPPDGGDPIPLPEGGTYTVLEKVPPATIGYFENCTMSFSGMGGTKIGREGQKVLELEDFNLLNGGNAKWDVTEKGQRVRVYNLLDQAEDNIVFVMDEAKSFELEWEPLADGSDISFEAVGLYNGAEETLGKVTYRWDEQQSGAVISGDFQNLGTNAKIIQVWNNGDLVEEWTDVTDTDFGFVPAMPISCGKLEDTPTTTPCYINRFGKKWPIRVGNESADGDEIRILTQTSGTITGLNAIEVKEFRSGNPDLKEITFINATVVTSSIRDLKHQTGLFEVFPNPASEELILELKNTNLGQGKYAVFDQNGTLQIVADLRTEQTKIDISKLPNGMYYLRVNFEGAFQTRRFVKFE